jgi:hypothetical protein
MKETLSKLFAWLIIAFATLVTLLITYGVVRIFLYVFLLTMKYFNYDN